jgi:integrase
MTKEKVTFTDELFRKINPSVSNKRSYLYDSKTTGLRLQITEKGTLTFQFQARDKKRGTIVTRTIEKYPAMSIAKAREEADRLRVKLHDGVDIENEAALIREEDTFNAIFYRWLDQFAKPHKKSWEEDERRYKLYFEKPFGHKKPSWFTQARVRKWHHEITTKPRQRGEGQITPSTANRALALLSTVFNQIMPDTTNPCKGVKKFHEESRDRFLQPEELESFFTAINDESTPALFRDYILVSLFTGARRANVMEMKWGEISFERETWTIPGIKSKNKTAMTIPLAPHVIDILKRRKQTTTSVFVFPGKGKTGHYCEPKTAWGTLVKKTGLSDLRIHDLRRTLGSWQTITGASNTIVGKTLGHKSAAATAVYSRLNLDPVRESIERAISGMESAMNMPRKVVSFQNTDGGK